MLTENDVAKVFDTILSIPGMNKTVKIDLKISRKNVMLLNHIIERGLECDNDSKTSAFLSSISPESIQESKLIGDECLQKEGLNDLYEKLKIFNESGK